MNIRWLLNDYYVTIIRILLTIIWLLNEYYMNIICLLYEYSMNIKWILDISYIYIYQYAHQYHYRTYSHPPFRGSSKHEDHELHPRPWRRKASSPLGSAVFAAPDGKMMMNQQILTRRSFFLHSSQQINVLEKTIHPHLLFSSIASQDRHIDSTGWFRVDLGSQTLNIWRNLLKKWGGSRYIYV